MFLNICGWVGSDGGLGRRERSLGYQLVAACYSSFPDNMPVRRRRSRRQAAINNQLVRVHADATPSSDPRPAKRSATVPSTTPTTPSGKRKRPRPAAPRLCHKLLHQRHKLSTYRVAILGMLI